MGTPAVLKVGIVADAKGAAKGVAEAEGMFSNLSGKLKGLGIAAAAGATAGVLGIVSGSVAAASQLQQSYGGLDAVFKGSSAQMKAWAKNAAESAGLAKGEYAEMATVLGASLKNQGVPMSQLADQTNTLIQKGADLASLYGGTTKDAVEALTAAFRGEADPAERFGLNLSQTAVNAYKAAHASENLSDSQVRIKLLMQQSADATGNFSKESNTLEGQQQRLNAKFDNIRATVGSALLPVLVKLGSWVSDTFLPKAQELGSAVLPVVATAFDAIKGPAQAVYDGLVGLGKWVADNQTFLLPVEVGLGAIAVAMAAEAAAAGVAAIATGALGIAVAILESPVLLVVGAIALLAAGVYLAYQKCDVFRAIVNTLWTVLGTLVKIYLIPAKLAFEAVTTVVGFVIDKIGALVGWVSRLAPVRAAFEGIRDAAGWVADKVSDVVGWFGRIAVPAALGILKTSFDGLRDAVGFVIDKVKSLWDMLNHIPGAGVLKNIIGFSLPTGAAAGPSAMGYAARDGRAVGAGSLAVLRPSISLTVTIDGQQLQGRIESGIDRAMNRDGARLLARGWA